MGGFLRHTTSNLFNPEEEAMTPLEDKIDNLSQDIEQILEEKIASLSDYGEGTSKVTGITEATTALTQLFNKRLEAELTELRYQFRGEDPDQYRPNDMTSMRNVEDIIDDRIAQLKEAQ